jgi:hypothetical protein
MAADDFFLQAADLEHPPRKGYLAVMATSR